MSSTYRYFSLFLVAALALSVAGCGGAPAPTVAPAAPTAAPAASTAAVAAPTAAVAAPTAAPAAQPVTINIWTGFPELGPVYKAVGADYTKSHPNVTFAVLTADLRSMETKLSTSVAAGSGPDVYDIGPNIIVKFVDGKLVDPNPADIDQFVKSGAYTKAQVDYFTYGGKTYGIPLFDGSLASLYYNKTMFKAAGLDPNKPPTTWDEMMADAQKLTLYDSSGNITQSGISLRLSGQGSGIAEKFWFPLHNMGADILVPTADGTKWHNGYNNAAGQKALQYYIDAVYKYHVDDQKFPADADAFAAGKTAMLLREGWVIGTIQSTNPGLDYGVVPMPKDVKWDTLFQPWGVYVNKNSPNQATAWDFVKFLTNKDNAVLLTNISYWPSCRHDVDWTALFKTTPQFQTFVQPAQGLGFYAYPPLAEFDEIETKMATRLVADYLDKTLLNNPAGIAKAIQDMANETDSILKQAGDYGTG